jgi:very-short-patch-repair endonuclease
MNRQRVTARQVLDFLVDQKQVIVPVDGAGG